MANKRIKKKQQKQKVQQKLQQKGYTEKQIKRLPEKEVKKVASQVIKNERKQAKRQANRNYIRKNNLTESYKYNGKVYKGADLVDLSPEVLKKFAKLQERREKERALQITKRQKMLDVGLPEHLADKYKTKSYKYVNDAIFKGDRTIYKGKESLSVLWSDVTGESHYDLALTDFNDMPTKEMISQIHKEYQYASKGKILPSAYRDTDKYFLGVARIQISSNVEKLEQHAKKAQRNTRYHNGHVKKGYKGKGVAEDGHFLTSNEFTVRGYANMMLSVMTRAKPEHVVQYYSVFETYAFHNFPEIHKQIFKKV